MSDFVVGDVSGYKKSFDSLIKKDFISRIIALGDIIDRGPESRQMIEFFMNNPQHQTLMGNHEHMMIKAYENVVNGLRSPYYTLIWVYVNGGKETLESYGVSVPALTEDRRAMLNMTKDQREKILESPEIKDLYSQFSKIPVEHIQFLKSLPLYLETNKAFMSHAPIKNWREPKLFQYKAFDENELLLDLGCLWNRSNPNKQRLDKKLFIYGHENKNKVLAHTKKHPNGIYVDILDMTLPKGTWGVCIDTMKAGFLTGLRLDDLSLHYSIID